MEDDSLYLQPTLECKVHPVVLFTILDHHMRRNDGESRVIGTLVGSVKNGIVEIKNCFPVPHSEGEEVAVDLGYHQSMVSLHRQISPKDIFLGWYSSSSDINENSGIIFAEFYSKEIKDPKLSQGCIHLTLDTDLTNYQLNIRTFFAETIQLPGKEPVGVHFEPIPFELKSFDAEKVGVDALVKVRENPNGTRNIFSDLSNLETSVTNLSELLDLTSEYVNKVLKGEAKPDPEIGRFISNALASLPKMDSASLEQMFNNSLRDLLMVVYLANLTRSTLTLAEKVQNK